MAFSVRFEVCQTRGGIIINAEYVKRHCLSGQSELVCYLLAPIQHLILSFAEDA